MQFLWSRKSIIQKSEADKTCTHLHKEKQLELELQSAVDKIYELRDIVRTLELENERKCTEDFKTPEVVKELKVALKESSITQQIMQEELDNLRNLNFNTQNEEHIKNLEEQLKSKTQELKSLRGASSYVSDIKAQLWGLVEQVEQNVMQLENSFCGNTSTTSSHHSNPVSEDVDSSDLITNQDEIITLENRLKAYQKAGSAAIQKVRKVEEENLILNEQVKVKENEVANLLQQFSAMKDECDKVNKNFNDYQKKGNLNNDRNLYQDLKEKYDDLDIERELLQAKSYPTANASFWTASIYTGIKA